MEEMVTGLVIVGVWFVPFCLALVHDHFTKVKFTRPINKISRPTDSLRLLWEIQRVQR